MSRETIYNDERLTVVGGQDMVLGNFLQVFDKYLENETPEGEGLVYSWTELRGVEINLTGISSTTQSKELIDIYIKQTQEE